MLTALASSGIEWAELLEPPPEEMRGMILVGGATGQEIADRRQRVARVRRAELVEVVLGRREELKAEQKAKLLAGQGAGGNANADAEREKGNSSVAAELARQAAMLESTNRRIGDDKARLAAANELAQQRAQEQMRIDAEFAKQKALHEEHVREHAAKVSRERFAREEDAKRRAEAEILKGHEKQAARLVRDKQIQEKIKAQQEEYRARAGENLKKHSQKLENLMRKNKERQERAVEMASITEAKMAESEAKRLAKVAEMNKKIKADNKARNEENERRRQAKIIEDARALMLREEETLAKFAANDARMLSIEEQAREEQLKRVAAENSAKLVRQEKHEQMLKNMVQSAGAKVGKAEEKAMALDRAIKRKDHQLAIRAEESRLEFQKKQFQVKRLAKQQEYQRQLAEGALDRKNARLDMVNGAKKESILQRKKVAQDFVVKKQLLKDEAEREGRRQGNAAGGGGGSDPKSQKKAANRLSQPTRVVKDATELLFGPKATVDAF